MTTAQRWRKPQEVWRQKSQRSLLSTLPARCVERTTTQEAPLQSAASVRRNGPIREHQSGKQLKAALAPPNSSGITTNNSQFVPLQSGEVHFQMVAAFTARLSAVILLTPHRYVTWNGLKCDVWTQDCKKRCSSVSMHTAAYAKRNISEAWTGSVMLDSVFSTQQNGEPKNEKDQNKQKQKTEMCCVHTAVNQMTNLLALTCKSHQQRNVKDHNNQIKAK